MNKKQMDAEQTSSATKKRAKMAKTMNHKKRTGTDSEIQAREILKSADWNK
jgi:hypothetical protein